MGLLGSRDKAPPTQEPRSLIASAVQVKLTDRSWKDFRLRDEEWQVECWRLYDIIGELHFAANYIGSACSRVRVYVAEVDDKGRVGDEVSSDEEVQSIADTLFGGPSSKSEALRSLGIGLTIAGEMFLIGRAEREADPDTWMVVAPSELKRQAGTMYVDLGGGKMELVPDKDLVIRLWTPHPRRFRYADCPARAALAVLREIEQLTKFVFSQIDSRLAGAGILPIPSNLSFPHGDDVASGAEGLMRALTDAATAGIAGHGTASAVVPILVEMTPEAINAMPDKPIRFESELSEKAKELRDEAIRRLSLALDMPPEVLTGTGDTNHWSAWHIEESAVKIHVEPLMTRICQALTIAYLQPLLKLKKKDPKKFTFWFDTAPLTVRPNRLQDTLNLFERGIVSAEAVLRAGNYNPTMDAPDQEEENTRYIKEVILRDPSLFAIPQVREAVGIEIDTTVPELATPPPPPPAPERSVESDQPDALPEQPTTTQPVKTSGNNNGLIASADAPELVEPPSAVLVAADLMVIRALELAGKRLLTPTYRGQWPNVPCHELHTKIKVRTTDQVNRLLAGAWDHLPQAADTLNLNANTFQKVLERYCLIMLTRSTAHHRSLLAAMLRDHGVL